MTENPNERLIKWVYEIVSCETAEVITVLSRKYISELSATLRKFYYYKCIGYFGYDNVYNLF